VVHCNTDLINDFLAILPQFLRSKDQHLLKSIEIESVYIMLVRDIYL
jgi:hypothetical protein